MKRFAFALIAAMAFAMEEDHEHMEGEDHDHADEAMEEEVVDSWSARLVWDADTGVDQQYVDTNATRWKSGVHTRTVEDVQVDVSAMPDENGVNMFYVDSVNQWTWMWDTSSAATSKKYFATWSMGWVAEADMTDPANPLPVSWEFTQCVYDRSNNNNPSVSGPDSFTGNFDAESLDPTKALDLRKSGADAVPEIFEDQPVSVWSGSCEGMEEVINRKTYVTGMKANMSRPWEPTADAMSAITLKNQEPQYLCVLQWTARDNTFGNADSGCTTVMIDIPVPEPEPEPVEPTPTDSGANALTTAAFAVAAIAAMAF